MLIRLGHLMRPVMLQGATHEQQTAVRQFERPLLLAGVVAQHEGADGADRDRRDERVRPEHGFGVGVPPHGIGTVAIQIEKNAVEGRAADLFDASSDIEESGCPSGTRMLHARVAVDDPGVCDERGQSREGPEAVAKLLPRHVAPQRFEQPVGLRRREEVLPVPDPAAIAQRDCLAIWSGVQLEHRQHATSPRLRISLPNGTGGVTLSLGRC